MLQLASSSDRQFSLIKILKDKRQMERFGIFVFYLTCIASGQGSRLSINPHEVIVKHGDPFCIRCSSSNDKISEHLSLSHNSDCGEDAPRSIYREEDKQNSQRYTKMGFFINDTNSTDAVELCVHKATMNLAGCYYCYHDGQHKLCRVTILENIPSCGISSIDMANLHDVKLILYCSVRYIGGVTPNPEWIQIDKSNKTLDSICHTGSAESSQTYRKRSCNATDNFSKSSLRALYYCFVDSYSCVVDVKESLRTGSILPEAQNSDKQPSSRLTEPTNSNNTPSGQQGEDSKKEGCPTTASLSPAAIASIIIFITLIAALLIFIIKYRKEVKRNRDISSRRELPLLPTH